MAEAVFRRLNPLTIVLEFVRVLGRFVYFIVLVLFTSHSSGDFVVEAIGGVIVLAAVARYLTFSFAVHEGNLIVRSGILVRNVRTVPLSKIQNINVSKNLIHRFFGLVDLKIETAAGRHAEVAISALSERDADALKRELTQGVVREMGGAPTSGEVRGRTVYRINGKELFLAGATENRTLAIIATFLGGSAAFQSRLEELGRRFMPDFHGSWLAIAVFIFMVLLVGWVISIISAVINYANFELTLEEGRLRRHYGLINQIESVVPLPRVQVVRISETLLQRMLNICKLYVETAGTFDKKDMHGASLVSPLLEQDRLPDIVHTILPGRRIYPVMWQRISPKTIRVHAQRSVITYGVIVGAASLYFGPKALWSLVPLAAWSVFTAWVHYRTTGFQDKLDVLATRLGVFSRGTLFVPTEKIQCVAVHESPLQRRLHLATVVVNTAAVGHGGTGRVVDIETSAAGSLALSLHGRSTASVRMTGEAL